MSRQNDWPIKEMVFQMNKTRWLPPKWDHFIAMNRASEYQTI
jgi:hypothetical protein